jgi:hypothetical protein
MPCFAIPKRMTQYSKPTVVVGLDFDTTFSGFAFCKTLMGSYYKMSEGSGSSSRAGTLRARSLPGIFKHYASNAGALTRSNLGLREQE